MAVDMNQAIGPVIAAAVAKDKISSDEAQDQRILDRAEKKQLRAADALQSKLKEKMNNKMMLRMRGKYGKGWEKDVDLYLNFHNQNPLVSVDAYASMMGDQSLVSKINDFINIRADYSRYLTGYTNIIGALDNYHDLDDKKFGELTDKIANDFDKIPDENIRKKFPQNEDTYELLLNSAAYSEAGLKKAPNAAKKVAKYRDKRANEIYSKINPEYKDLEKDLTGGLK